MFVPQGDFTLGDTTDVSGTAKEGFDDKPFCRQTAPTEKKRYTLSVHLSTNKEYNSLIW